MELQRARPAIVVLVLLASTPGRARDLFDEIYERGRPLESSLKTITATFTEETTSPLLVRPLVARGTLAVARPSRVALRYTSPEPREVIIDGDVLTLVWPTKQVRRVRDIGASQRRVQKYFVDKSPDELRRHFAIDARAASDRPRTWVVTMVPMRKQIQQGITKLELWIDRQTLLLDAMRMTFPGGETKLMTFADVKTNVPMDEKSWEISGSKAPTGLGSQSLRIR